MENNVQAITQLFCLFLSNVTFKILTKKTKRRDIDSELMTNG